MVEYCQRALSGLEPGSSVLPHSHADHSVLWLLLFFRAVAVLFLVVVIVVLAVLVVAIAATGCFVLFFILVAMEAAEWQRKYIKMFAVAQFPQRG